MKLSEIAKVIGAQLANANDGDVAISRLGSLNNAKSDELTFLANPEYEKHLGSTQAAAVIVAKHYPECRAAQIIHKNPYIGYAKAAAIFYAPVHERVGVSDRAVIHPTAEVATDATIFPFVYIAPKARIGKRVVIYPGCYIGEGAEVGDDTVLYANVVLQHRVKIGHRVIIHPGTVIGADGFGFAPGDNEIVKIPQVGTVVIDDDVEIGAVCTVDRAAIDQTHIGEHCKLDSKVHVGHNVQIGHHTMMSALVGIAGSAKIGTWVLMGGHSGVSNNINVADRTKVGSMTGVVQDTEAGETYMGFPARPASQWRRQVVGLGKLPEMSTKIRDLSAKVTELENSLNELRGQKPR